MEAELFFLGKEKGLRWWTKWLGTEYKDHSNLESIFTIAHYAPELDAAVNDRSMAACLPARNFTHSRRCIFVLSHQEDWPLLLCQEYS